MPVNSNIYAQARGMADVAGGFSEGVSVRQMLDKANRLKKRDERLQNVERVRKENTVIDPKTGQVSMDSSKSIAEVAQYDTNAARQMQARKNQQSQAAKQQKYDRRMKERDYKLKSRIQGVNAKDKADQRAAGVAVADEKEYKDIFKTYEYESRGTSHLKRLSTHSALIDKALYQIKDFEGGIRPLDLNAAKDLSAAATALITGGIPPQKLIDDTTYNTLQGKVKNWGQWFSGRPAEFYTPALIENMRKQFKTYEKNVKHRLSKHASSVWNRSVKVRGRNPKLGSNELYTYGHKLGAIDPKTGLAKPRAIEDPYTSVDNQNYPSSVAQHNDMSQTRADEMADQGRYDLASEEAIKGSGGGFPGIDDAMATDTAGHFERVKAMNRTGIVDYLNSRKAK